MKHKILLTSLLGLTIVCPSMAEVNVDITAGTNNPGCNNTVLHTYSGPTSLEAEYTANTINLKWYGADGEITTVPNASKTCTYDGSITLPTTNPTRTGYTFAGWQVRVASNNNNNNNQTPITLSSLYSSGDITVFSSKSLTPREYCEGSAGWDDENEDYLWYGTSEGGSCSDSAFTGLNDGEWRVTMPNGSVVKGVATCSTQSGDNHDDEWGGNSADWSLASDALTAGQYSTNNSTGLRYCWCKATSADSGNGYQPVSSSSWVFYYDHGSANDCTANCLFDCASVVAGDDGFRRAVFGVTQ